MRHRIGYRIKLPNEILHCICRASRILNPKPMRASRASRRASHQGSGRPQQDAARTRYWRRPGASRRECDAPGVLYFAACFAACRHDHANANSPTCHDAGPTPAAYLHWCFDRGACTGNAVRAKDRTTARSTAANQSDAAHATCCSASGQAGRSYAGRGGRGASAATAATGGGTQARTGTRGKTASRKGNDKKCRAAAGGGCARPAAGRSVSCRTGKNCRACGTSRTCSTPRTGGTKRTCDQCRSFREKLD